MFNRATLIGNVGSDPEMRQVASGQLASFSVATNRKYTKKDGEAVDETQWHRITVFGKSADFVESYIRKGDKVFVEGRIEYRMYEDRDGNEKMATQITVAWPEGTVKKIGGPFRGKDKSVGGELPQMSLDGS